MQGINYDILNQDKVREDGKALADKHLNMVKEALDARPKYVKSCPTRRVSDLTIPEFKNLMVDCFEMLKQRETDTSVKEYDKITTKPIKIEEVFVKDGKTVPQEY